MYYAKSTGSFYSSEVFTILPADAVEISEELHSDLLAGQGQWKKISSGQDGQPILLDCPPTSDDLIKQAIVALESQQTPRRIREATLEIDNGWLAGIEAQIEALRAQLGVA